jgi:hypothetical protein
VLHEMALAITKGSRLKGWALADRATASRIPNEGFNPSWFGRALRETSVRVVNRRTHCDRSAGRMSV